MCKIHKREDMTKYFAITSFLSLLFFSISAFAENIPPSDDEIHSWWQGEEMKIEGKPLQVSLLNKEIAYIAPVGFYQRGRNNIWHSVLVRPTLKEVREITGPVGKDCVVHDFNNDGISEIETVSLGSGQGTTRGEKTIVQFDGWKSIVLHRNEFHDNLGCCGSPPGGCGKCNSQEVKWKFNDPGNNGNNYLVEEIIIKEGASRDKINFKKKIIREFQLEDNRLNLSNGKPINAKYLRQRLQSADVSSEKYSINGDPLPKRYGGVLDRVSGYWRIRDYERGKFRNEIIFSSETEACIYFFDKTMPFYVSRNNKKFFEQRSLLD